MSEILRKDYGPAIHGNLRASLLYAFRAAEELIAAGKVHLTGEIILRQFRDVWLYRENALLSERVEIGVREMNTALSEDDLLFLRDLEKASRKEKDYLEFIVKLDDDRAFRLLAAAEKAMGEAQK